ncbi:hypothetical protein AAFO90_23795 [Phaeobacter sp. CAU 1743]|uniref:hypothetical protein n=1 Tax=Phaeobacter sp. CAU 1743 TaxID=3140367 RepID=UPI00325A58A1
MNFMKVSLLVATLGVLSSVRAVAGPFGVDSTDGFDLDQYECSEIAKAFYSCENVPKPHPDFEQYIVQYHPEVGVCMIKGVGKDIQDNRYGGSTVSAVDEIYGQVSSKYGEVKKFDYLMTGSIWDEPEDWMMGLAKDERTYAYFGEITPVVDGISKYIVAGKASRSDVGYVIVEFHTPVTDDCDTKASDDAASSF